MKLAALPSLTVLSSFTALAFAAEWPQYRGPQLDGSSAETIKVTGWPAGGPAQVWKTQANTGFSSFVIGGGKALTLVEREVDGNAMEVCVALDAATGKEVWATPLWLGKDYGHNGGNAGTPDNGGGDGPRSTPTIDGDKVYAIDAHLRVYCLELATGKEIWKRNIAKEYAGPNIKWMNAASPVIDGDLLFAAGGGSGQALLAFNKKDGALVWKAEDDMMTHATPTVANIQGTRQVIFFTQKGLVSVVPASGKVLWRYPFRFNVSTAASPVVSGDIVYCSAGYGVGAGAVKVTKTGDAWAAEQIWRTENKNMNHWSTPVEKDGYLYGMFGFKEYGSCPLACLDVKTGEMKWSQEGYGPGNVILVNGQLLALSDQGELVVVTATPDAYKEIARADLLEGKCWSTPALADGKVYIRSTQEAGCYDLSGAKVSLR